MAPYPTATELRTMFSDLVSRNIESALEQTFSADLGWHVLGHSPMSGVWHSLPAIQEQVSYINLHILTSPMLMEVVNVVGGGDQDQAVIELRGNGECRNGLKWDMIYCWIVKFDDTGKIKTLRAYLDTDLLTRAIQQNCACDPDGRILDWPAAVGDNPGASEALMVQEDGGCVLRNAGDGMRLTAAKPVAMKIGTNIMN